MKKILQLSLLLFLIQSQVSCQNSNKQEKNKQTNIIFKDKIGRTLSMSDLENVTGNVNYEIMDNINISSKASQLHQKGRELGGSGKYDEAIIVLKNAMEIEPNWAYPIYDLAFTYLLQGNNDKALEFYKKTNIMKPNGFFTTKTAIYSLEGEKLGKFPVGLYATYIQIEWLETDEEKRDLVKKIVYNYPSFGPAWKDFANLLNSNIEKLNAIEKGLQTNPDEETKGVLTINKALLLNEQGKKDEAKEILGNIIVEENSTKATIEMAKFTLKSIL